MKNKIFVIKSSKIDINPLFNLFDLLQEKNYELLFFSNKKSLIKYCKEKKIYIKKIKNIFYFFNIFFFTIFLPIIYIYAFIKLIYYKFKFKIKHVACFNNKEKIIFTSVAKILKIKIVWLELPKEKKEKSNFILNFLLKKISKQAKLIVFKETTKNKLIKSGFNSSSINFIAPGINLKQNRRQENIFNNLAYNKKSVVQKNFFTIGTVATLNSEQTIEILFGAVKKALNVIPNLQIIIIGDGMERKKLTWLAQKMEINNLSWFVGEQTNLNKWFDSFNVFSTSCINANLSDIFTLLKAMGAELPIISTENHGFDSIIENNKNGLLLPKDDSELLARAIIKLQQNEELSKNLGKNAKNDILNKMTLNLMVDNFLKIL